MIMTCMLHAHMMNIIQLGSYNVESNRLLKANNLPSVVLPDNPPSQELINTSQKVPATQEPTITKPSTSKQNQQAEPEESTEEETSDESETDEGTQSHTETPALKPIKGEDIGLQIYAKQSEPFPKKGLDLKKLTTGMLRGTYKWTYTFDKFREEDVLRHLNNNEISLRDSWVTVEDQVFKNIRNGYKHQQTPPPSKGRNRDTKK